MAFSKEANLKLQLPLKFKLIVPTSVATKEEMLEIVNLQQVAIDLKNLGMFLRVAYSGVVGYTDLQIQVRGVYYNVADLCDESVRMIKNSKRAIQYLQSAYQLSEG